MSGPGPGERLTSRVSRRLAQMAVECEYFDEETEVLGLDGWIDAWSDSGSRVHGRSSRIVAVAYERIVNDLQEAAETIEIAALSVGIIPDPALVKGDKAAWWEAAAAAELEIAAADRSQGPGRWRRLAFYGHISHDLASDLKIYCDVRQVFQHGYALRQHDSDIAEQAWDSMKELRAELSQVLAGLEAFERAVLDELD